ncbi:uncharacterized protein BDV14DRAFT_172855 [Aspergillus stella-maris]|uniref:uncharacterized protein n=1 Tax=Aspergillus stella-maris TaxID=1810926 RepID=UPI003CCD5F47
MTTYLTSTRINQSLKYKVAIHIISRRLINSTQKTTIHPPQHNRIIAKPRILILQYRDQSPPPRNRFKKLLFRLALYLPSPRKPSIPAASVHGHHHSHDAGRTGQSIDKGIYYITKEVSSARSCTSN